MSGVEKDARGNPIVVGIGSKSYPTRNSVEAYRKHCQNEPDYPKHLARMESELEEYLARKKATA